MINTNKYIRNDDYIDTINKIYEKLVNTYKDGEQIDVSKDLSNYNWFYMDYNKRLKKYVFNKNEIDKLKELYNSKMNNKSFYMKFYIDAQNKNLHIYFKKK